MGETALIRIVEEEGAKLLERGTEKAATDAVATVVEKGGGSILGKGINVTKQVASRLAENFGKLPPRSRAAIKILGAVVGGSAALDVADSIYEGKGISEDRIPSVIDLFAKARQMIEGADPSDPGTKKAIDAFNALEEDLAAQGIDIGDLTATVRGPGGQTTTVSGTGGRVQATDSDDPEGDRVEDIKVITQMFYSTVVASNIDKTADRLVRIARLIASGEAGIRKAARTLKKYS